MSVDLTPGAADSKLEEDPLGIDKLSIDFDYLLYKIHGYVETIQLQTIDICHNQYTLIDEGIIEGVIDRNIQEFKKLLEKCNELENHFDMLDQIEMITKTFSERLTDLVTEYRQIKQSRS
ncbi:Cnl1p NDAI_0B05530 [Naumovozyma dairenensis CBS 421]|uniref:Biogenesis of lysosome-related organelles complex 1 subunit CNL1 n=1 Tax=Naumovozyma dairenensis (strain ATCC 10597 / BCRC 20456 / CBS 421 / NBRC 0211 / NRRL Y-12639) TaxID=1071378 RepID=G0W725_NAUDC|nr:hypothetical protein NDAI_0B05530 [Naumovozyma dairenensis CBS 421]CCD23586.1 hypothetical protein NDAI_0B05530 [Naumovozyma dairenensis CBS 421]